MDMMVIDIDGVVADTEDLLVKHIEESSGKKLEFANPRTFQFIVDAPVEDVLRYIDETIIQYKHVIEPHDYGSTYVALKMLEKRFGVVTFLSSRTNGPVEEATRWWLNKHFPTLVYNLCHLGEGVSKFNWMIDNGFNAIVDDRYRTVNECDFNNGYTYLVNRSWNVGRMERNHVQRVGNLYEAVNNYIGWLKKA